MATNVQSYKYFLRAYDASRVRGLASKSVEDIARELKAEWGEAAGSLLIPSDESEEVDDSIKGRSRALLIRAQRAARNNPAAPQYIYRDDPLALLIRYLMPSIYWEHPICDRGDGGANEIGLLAGRIESFLQASEDDRLLIAARLVNPETNEATESGWRIWSKAVVGDVDGVHSFTDDAIRYAIKKFNRLNPGRDASFVTPRISVNATAEDMGDISPEDAVAIFNFTVISSVEDESGEGLPRTVMACDVYRLRFESDG